ncbi:MAG: hypothetical protein HY899_18990 [Deltaproteobacteria bacterium]|nr:hypothetical protein [Deltaproteobacteria bacterium]
MTRTPSPRRDPRAASTGFSDLVRGCAAMVLLGPAAAGIVGLTGCSSGDRNAIPVTVSLQSETPSVSKATVLVDYSRTGAKIAQEEGRPSCAFILPGLAGEFSDDGQGALTVRLQAQRGLRGPADIVACRMLAAKADTEPRDIAARLDVKLTEAEDGAGKVIDLAAAPTTRRAPANEMADKKPTQKSLLEAKRLADEAAGRRTPNALVPAVVPPGTSAKPISPPAPPPAASTPGARPAPVLPSAPAATPPAARGAVLAAPSAAAPTANAGPVAGPGSGVSKDPGYDDSPSDQPKTAQYDVTVSVIGTTASLGALQFEVSHTGSSGGWVGHQGDVECEALVDALRASNYVGGRTVRVGLVSIQGMPTPGAMVRCSFRTPEYLSTSSFAIQVVDASDIDSGPIDPLPTMRVSSVVRR